MVFRTISSLFKAVFILLFLLFGFIETTRRGSSLPSKGEAIKFYSTHTNHDLKNILLKSINSAEESILLLIYSIKDDQIISALKRKAAKGCRVNVVVDRKASQGMHSQFGEEIQFTEAKMSGLMHHKLLVVDDSLILASSANCTKDSLRHQGNLSIAFHSPSIGEAIWNQAETLSDKSKKRIRKIEDFIAGQKIEIHFLPSLNAKNRLEDLLSKAKKNTRVAMYTLTCPDICTHLTSGKSNVSVVVDKGTAKGASRSALHLLKKTKSAVAISDTPALLHYKMAIIDQNTLIGGSANWTRGAFKKNYDNLIIVHELNKKQSSIIEKLWKAIWAESRNT